ncbi:ATP-binding protein [Roseateles saccharophilus]|uniref:histidine kinase n=1 Tax=Roseateles saccharophilus TaxID=304 RepID=A0A4R3V1E6_ROSSA|nr:ATP-binding protein [Roseateles saccharophilus]MDG0832304.1 HAMP domain-containing protein [Roseateles saccharophilus]TCU96998.1 signal transduction histidine kinase [Roseateles saccharophilus]
MLKRKNWDRLGLRLFLLMWGALVLSHVSAWMLASQTLHGPVGTHERPAPHAEDGGPPMPPPEGFGEGPRRPHEPGGHEEHEPHGPPGMAWHLPLAPSLPPSLPWRTGLLDYGVRLLVIALAAWWGSRWLALPVRRLVSAAQRLTPALAQGRPAPRLHEDEGTCEVRDAAAVFNRMAAELSGQFEERGLMIAAISHDLRTPLTRMRLRLETGEVEAGVRERCVDDIREMNRLVESVIEVFRPADAAPARRVDLSALAQSAVDDLAETGAAVNFEGPAAVVAADPLALRRVIDNLVGNALRYAGSARVSVALSAGVTRLVVEDDGPGIPEAELQRVRQPFRRVEGSRNRATGGTGLGLYIAQQLVRRQGAVLVLGNRPEGGLRAEVVF